MRILAVDVGTGTQDILVFDSSLAISNCPKLVMPSPTAMLADRIDAATASRSTLFFHGFTMGGGPSKGALKDHIASGGKAYATPDAARTFDDDLAELEEMGLIILPEGKPPPEDAAHIELKDIDLAAIAAALSAFGVSADFDLIAVAVQDHGAAPHDVSDRAFRFAHMQERLVQSNDLLAFTYFSTEVPPYLTRMIGVEKSLAPRETLIMDTGFACVLGADQDAEAAKHEDRLLVNLGNSHTIAFHLHQQKVLGMFEHHTHDMDTPALQQMVNGLADGSLTNQQVFDSGGHGAVVLGSHAGPHFIAAVGPQRARISAITPTPHPAVPHGDMMLAGCFGLLKACSLRVPGWRSQIEQRLAIDS